MQCFVVVFRVRDLKQFAGIPECRGYRIERQYDGLQRFFFLGQILRTFGVIPD